MKWVIFLDADVFVVDYSRKIETLIQFIDNNYKTAVPFTPRSHKTSFGSGDEGDSNTATSHWRSEDGHTGTGAEARTGSGTIKRFHCKVTIFDPLTP